ncbi:MAG: hypothetical protein ACOYT7_00330 [Patescibacteria group bacterium]
MAETTPDVEAKEASPEEFAALLLENARNMARYSIGETPPPDFSPEGATDLEVAKYLSRVEVDDTKLSKQIKEALDKNLTNPDTIFQAGSLVIAKAEAPKEIATPPQKARLEKLSQKIASKTSKLLDSGLSRRAFLKAAPTLLSVLATSCGVVDTQANVPLPTEPSPVRTEAPVSTPVEAVEATQIPTPTVTEITPETPEAAPSYPQLLEEMTLILGDEFSVELNPETNVWEIRQIIYEVPGPAVYVFDQNNSVWRETEFIYYAKVKRMAEIMSSLDLSTDTANLPSLSDLGLRPITPVEVFRDEGGVRVGYAYLIGILDKEVDLEGGQVLRTRLLAFSPRDGFIFWVPAYVEAFESVVSPGDFRTDLYQYPDILRVGNRYCCFNMVTETWNLFIESRETGFVGTPVNTYDEYFSQFISVGFSPDEVIGLEGKYLFNDELLRKLSLTEEQLSQDFPFPNNRIVPLYYFY